MSTVKTGVGLGILLGLLMSVLLWATASPAQAQSATECQAKIDALRDATLTAEFTGLNAEKDQLGLLGKLDSATTKLEKGKYQDAQQSLISFREKVATLAAEGKLNPDDASNLITLATQAIDCVQDLIDG